MYFISSYEIFEFINFVIKIDDKRLLESINWLGSDSNHLIFNSNTEYIYNSILLTNEKTVSIGRIKDFLISVNFVCLAHYYEESYDNMKIIEDIGSNPFVLQVVDCFLLLGNSFLKSRSTNKNKLRNIIKNITKGYIGLTGNLELTNNGSRKYSGYYLRMAKSINYKFSWNNIGSYDKRNGWRGVFTNKFKNATPGIPLYSSKNVFY